jgi:hypothetical protein
MLRAADGSRNQRDTPWIQAVKFRKTKTPKPRMCDWHGEEHATIPMALGNTRTRRIVDVNVCQRGLESILAGSVEGRENAIFLHGRNGAFLFDMWES